MISNLELLDFALVLVDCSCSLGLSVNIKVHVHRWTLPLRKKIVPVRSAFVNAEVVGGRLQGGIRVPLLSCEAISMVASELFFASISSSSW